MCTGLCEQSHTSVNVLHSARTYILSFCARILTSLFCDCFELNFGVLGAGGSSHHAVHQEGQGHKGVTPGGDPPDHCAYPLWWHGYRRGGLSETYLQLGPQQTQMEMAQVSDSVVVVFGTLVTFRHSHVDYSVHALLVSSQCLPWWHHHTCLVYTWITILARPLYLYQQKNTICSKYPLTSAETKWMPGRLVGCCSIKKSPDGFMCFQQYSSILSYGVPKNGIGAVFHIVPGVLRCVCHSDWVLILFMTVWGWSANGWWDWPSFLAYSDLCSYYTLLWVLSISSISHRYIHHCLKEKHMGCWCLCVVFFLCETFQICSSLKATLCIPHCSGCCRCNGSILAIDMLLTCTTTK